MTPMRGMVAPQGSEKECTPVRNRIFQAVVIWRDGEVEDADEITVYAPTAAEAEREAKKRWRTTVAMKWPHCRLEDVSIVPKKACDPPH